MLLPRLFDTDQHVTPPKDMWTSRMSKKKWGDLIPHIVTLPDGKEAWSFEDGAILHLFGVENVASIDPRKITWRMNYEDIAPACFEPKARLEVMDVDGVGAGLLFPSVAGQAAGIQHDELFVECLKTYNDGIWDWSELDRNRLIPTALIPNRDVETAMAELERVAKLGFRHYQFDGPPSGNPFPTAADDPFWALVEETGMVISMHGGGRAGRRPKLAPGAYVPPKKVAAAPVRDQETVGITRAGGLGVPTPLAALIFTGVMERFPKLKIGLIETSAGWLPSYMDELDFIYTQNRWLGQQKLKRLPSEYVKQVKISIDREIQGVKYRHQIGVDNMMFGTDYPHVGVFWPHTRFYVDLLFQNVPEDETEKVLWSNAAALYGVA